TFAEFLEREHVTHTRTSDHHPQSDLAEVGVKLFKSALRYLQSDRPADVDWVELVPQAIAAMNNTNSETTQFTPFELFYGVSEEELRAERNIAESEPIESAEEWQLRAAEQAQSLQQRQRRRVRDYANRRRSTRWFEPGELVSVRRQGLPIPVALQSYRRLGPFSVVHRQGVVYYLADLQGPPLARGIPGDTLMPYHMDDDQHSFDAAFDSSRASSMAIADAEHNSGEDDAERNFVPNVVIEYESETDTNSESDSDGDRESVPSGIGGGGGAIARPSPTTNMDVGLQTEPSEDTDHDDDSSSSSTDDSDDSDYDYSGDNGSESDSEYSEMSSGDDDESSDDSQASQPSQPSGGSGGSSDATSTIMGANDMDLNYPGEDAPIDDPDVWPDDETTR
ncbi:hypothetical protein H4R20_007017, partial [Coemansia guatemalensis]